MQSADCHNQFIFAYEGKQLQAHYSWPSCLAAGQIEKRKQIIVITMLSSGTLTNSIRFLGYLTTKVFLVKLSIIFNFFYDKLAIVFFSRIRRNPQIDPIPNSIHLPDLNGLTNLF